MPDSLSGRMEELVTASEARSPSGKAKVCKTFIGGSIPPRASKAALFQGRLEIHQFSRSVYRTFTTGLDGTPMPAWSDWVSPDQGWDLVHYLRTLQVYYKAGKSKTAPPSREKPKDTTAKSM
jgi:hypothetical protein